MCEVCEGIEEDGGRGRTDCGTSYRLSDGSVIFK